ncbi:thioesterase family protein [Kineosporia succinea]
MLIPLRWSDVDAFGHVNNVMTVRMLEEARVALLGENLLEQKAAGVGLLVARQEIEYVAPLNYRLEPVPVDVWVTRVGAADFELGYEVRGENGVHAVAETTLFAFDLAGERPQRLAGPLRERLLQWQDEPIRWRRRRDKVAPK